jgi:hypothetical protein
MIRASSIIAIKGKEFIVRHFDHEPTLTKAMLLARDRHLCAYCAQSFRVGELHACMRTRTTFLSSCPSHSRTQH